MNQPKPMTLRIFRNLAKKNNPKMRRYLSFIENNTPKKLDAQVAPLEKEVWMETDCLACANCCKTMTPTFSNKDVLRIAAHLNMTPEAFRTKWLRKERKPDGDWINKTEPCQFLNLADNKCSIYEVRPADCAGFPHLTKKVKDFLHIHKQNVEYCPATYRLVAKMMNAMPRKQVVSPR